MNFDYRFAVVAIAAAMMCGSAAVRPAFAQPATPATAAKSDAPAQQKGLTTRAIEAAKSAAQGAGDILTRVPCLPAALTLVVIVADRACLCDGIIAAEALLLTD